MSIELPSLTDPEVMVPVPARWNGGRVELLTRAATKADADAAAVAAGLLVEHTDDEGNVTLVPPRTGAQPTVSRIEVGPVTITPGTYDEDGNELTAPVIDIRHHDNWRITPTQVHEATGRPAWEVMILSWVANGSPLPQQNTAEEGIRYGEVELIDPDTISSPSVVTQ